MHRMESDMAPFSHCLVGQMFALDSRVQHWQSQKLYFDLVKGKAAGERVGL